MTQNETEVIRKQKKTFLKFLYLFLGLSCLTFFLPWLFTRYAWTDILAFDAATGTLGDTIGGTMGPFVGLIGGLLTFLAFWEQYKANEQQRSDIKRQKHQADVDSFEKTFFEMIRLHRENVSEFNYTKYDGSAFRKSESRKVFRIIFREFFECYQEIKKFSNSKDPDDYFQPRYKKKLQRIVNNVNPNINLIELALIDIAYSIVFYGVGMEGIVILRNRFVYRYNNPYFYRLLRYIKLKPKVENQLRFENWEYIKNLDIDTLRELIEGLYTYNNHIIKRLPLSREAYEYLQENDYDKYYGGHQHRLGHYFRHLFQTYKYLHYNKIIGLKEKYFYGKTLRAQLSTYEQALLFINSLSSLGMRWEYTPEIGDVTGKPVDEITKLLKDARLISTYGLIKNLPGRHIFGIRYKTYYPNIEYESDEYFKNG